MRNTLNPYRGMLFSLVLLSISCTATASGFSDKFAEKVTQDNQAQEQIKNAVDALEATVESAITKGEVTRGASGPMMQLIYSSDTLICASWIIAFRQELQRLSIKQDPSPDELRMWKAAWDLLTRVELACSKVLQPGQPATAQAVGTAGTQSSTPTNEGRPFFERRPGWTVVDEICYRECEMKNAEREKANWDWTQATERERQARDRQTSAERERAAEQERLAKAEERLKSARQNLQRREDFNRRAGGEGAKNSPSNMLLSNALASVRDATEEVQRGRSRVADKERAAAEARGTAERATAARQRAEQEAANAQAALESCLRDCYKRAGSAPGSTTGASTGTATGTSTGTTTGTTTGTSAGTTSGGFTGFQGNAGASGD